MIIDPRRSSEDQQRTMTVRDATYDLLRACGLTTIFGNVGSTEEAFLKDFPSTFATCWHSRRPRWSRWPMASRRRRASRRSSTSTPEPVWETRWGAS